ncbi:uncharacterized protein PAC_03803 [Phialocephala subalpina]|uniref:Uncharacterized protein n=1 Tax=Phialocephala subalpina TaxID=576137 RepID=A0A1L7WMB9_9HELO|nr:uncharacterized protein PAC_03803 [Phialocephala subalpina]
MKNLNTLKRVGHLKEAETMHSATATHFPFITSRKPGPLRHRPQIRRPTLLTNPTTQPQLPPRDRRDTHRLHPSHQHLRLRNGHPFSELLDLRLLYAIHQAIQFRVPRCLQRFQQKQSRFRAPDLHSVHPKLPKTTSPSPSSRFPSSRDVKVLEDLRDLLAALEEREAMVLAKPMETGNRTDIKTGTEVTIRKFERVYIARDMAMEDRDRERKELDWLPGSVSGSSWVCDWGCG